MKTFDELAKELKLNSAQSQAVQQYLNDLVIELLESVKEDIVKNTDETISQLQT
jgi:hypothetical protein